MSDRRPVGFLFDNLGWFWSDASMSSRFDGKAYTPEWEAWRASCEQTGLNNTGVIAMIDAFQAAH